MIVFFGYVRQMRQYMAENRLNPREVIHFRARGGLQGIHCAVQAVYAGDFNDFSREYQIVRNHIDILNQIYATPQEEES